MESVIWSCPRLGRVVVVGQFTTAPVEMCCYILKYTFVLWCMQSCTLHLLSCNYCLFFTTWHYCVNSAASLARQAATSPIMLYDDIIAHGGRVWSTVEVEADHAFSMVIQTRWCKIGVMPLVLAEVV